MKSAVTLIFFNRPQTLEKVFAEVKKAKPPRLFLVQDGAREGNENDARGIEACRRIVENVDWECEVHKNYSEKNLGCGVRPQSGITWALSCVESTIILEDDCVPDQTFFAYCDEMLERYKNDDRIAYVSGLNHFEEWDFGGSSYGFTKGGAIWGWATWKRAWDRYDYSVCGINDGYLSSLIEKTYSDADAKIKLWKRTNADVNEGKKISYWDTQWGFVKYTQNQLVIVPKYNLISNIGVGEGSTHATKNGPKHQKYKDYNNMPIRALEFPLVHPSHMMCDAKYDELLAKCNDRAGKRVIIGAVKNKLLGIFGGKA